MKKTLNFSLLLLFMLCSCSREEENQQFSRQPGDEIIFGAVLDGTDTGVQTRVGYSGGELVTVGTGDNAKKYERIDWENGDVVRIYCPQASEPAENKYEDYFVTGVGADGRKSSASIDHNQGNIGLRWGTGLHKFFSMYPHENNGIDGTGLSVSSNVGLATCILPSTQLYASLTQDQNGNWIAAPYKKYIYLAGYAQATAGGVGGPVEIKYNPAVTTFQITVQNDFDDSSAMTVASAGIETEEGSLTGIYSVNLDGSLDKDDITLTPGSSLVTMNFRNPGNSDQNYITLQKGKKLTFTVFAHPKYDITKLTFWMIDNEGYKRTSALKYRGATDTDWVTFPAFHKANITGLMAPKSSKWYIEMGTGSTVTLDEWVDGGSPNVTQITLKQTRLEVWCKENSNVYTYYKSETDATNGNNAISMDAIMVNGSFTDSTKPSVSDLTGHEIAKLVSASIEKASSDPDDTSYQLELSYNANPSGPTFTNGVINDIIYVNHEGTNSYAQVDVTIHKL